MRRNKRRRQDFLEKKHQSTPVRSATAAIGNKETTSRNNTKSTEKKSFKCDLCDLEFYSEKGLKGHAGKKSIS